MNRLVSAIGACVVATAIAAGAMGQATRNPPRDHDSAAQQALAESIDRALADAWQTQGLLPAPPVDDAAWLRRLSVDLRGAIASRDEVARFLDDAGGDKRARKVDEYLNDRQLGENLALLWTNLLLAGAGKRDTERTKPWLRDWLNEQFVRGASFSSVASRLVAEAAAAPRPGATSFVLSYRDAIDTLSGVTARALLGVQIQCAQCHDDPNGRWKRDDFNRFTSFFLDMHADHTPRQTEGIGAFRVVDRSPEANLKAALDKLAAASGRMDGPSDDMGADDMSAEMDTGTDPEMEIDTQLSVQPGAQSTMRAGAAAEPDADPAALAELMKLLENADSGSSAFRDFAADPQKLDALCRRLPTGARDLVESYRERQELFGKAAFLDGRPYVAAEGKSKRAALAEWMVAPDNPWFAKAIVNRTWSHLFGKGLIEPVDDLLASGDPAASQVLDELGKAFVAHDTDVRFLLGTLARTKAYGVGGSTGEADAERERRERLFAAHPLRPFTVEQMTRSFTRLGLTADVASPSARGGFVKERGGQQESLTLCFGDLNGGGFGGVPPTIPQALFFMNGGYSHRTDVLRRGPLAQAFQDESRAPIVRLRPLFLAALGRPPSQVEAERLVELAAGREGGAPAAFDDLFWALVNSTEFHTNH